MTRLVVHEPPSADALDEAKAQLEIRGGPGTGMWYQIVFVGPDGRANQLVEVLSWKATAEEAEAALELWAYEVAWQRLAQHTGGAYGGR